MEGEGDFFIARQQLLSEWDAEPTPHDDAMQQDWEAYNYGLALRNRINKIRKFRRRKETRRSNRALKYLDRESGVTYAHRGMPRSFLYILE